MGPVRSLAALVLVGAALWTFGLLLVVSALLAAVIEHRGDAASLVHGALGHTAVVVASSLGLLAAGAWLVRRGLASLARLHGRLMDVRRGLAARVDGRYPSEVQPLVDDLNALLDVRERMVRRAQARAGDLAHGLKTPLAVLALDVERAEALGHADLAHSLTVQTTRMQRQIDYHLAQSRSAAGAGAVAAATAVEPSAAALATTLARLHAGRDLSIDVHIPSHVAVRCEREDLDEMLGNLMDNACKWARTRVAVTSEPDAGGLVVVVVEDDGPGLDFASHQAVLARGVRLDESVPGSGLGLAIVHDLAELHGGSLRLARSQMGGVAARLTLPSAPDRDVAV
jgi:signal transduction histidine kinase